MKGGRFYAKIADNDCHKLKYLINKIATIVNTGITQNYSCDYLLKDLGNSLNVLLSSKFVIFFDFIEMLYNETELSKDYIITFYQTYHDYSALYFDKNENDVTLSETKNKIETLCKINQELKSLCIAYCLHSEQDLFEYLKDATLNGESFFDTQYGKAELKMFAKLCNILREAMYYQYKQNRTILPVSKHLNLIE